MFGKRLRELEPIKEAVAAYAARASEKLRAQQSLCKRVRISIRTGMFNPDEPKFAKGVVCELPYPTDDTDTSPGRRSPVWSTSIARAFRSARPRSC